MNINVIIAISVIAGVGFLSLIYLCYLFKRKTLKTKLEDNIYIYQPKRIFSVTIPQSSYINDSFDIPLDIVHDSYQDFQEFNSFDYSGTKFVIRLAGSLESGSISPSTTSISSLEILDDILEYKKFIEL